MSSRITRLKGPRTVSCRRGSDRFYWRPHLPGTQQYFGNQGFSSSWLVDYQSSYLQSKPRHLAHHNMYTPVRILYSVVQNWCNNIASPFPVVVQSTLESYRIWCVTGVQGKRHWYFGLFSTATRFADRQISSVRWCARREKKNSAV